MKPRVVLDASAFDQLDSSRGKQLRAMLVRAVSEGSELYCAAVTLAEVCRGASRTRRVEEVLAKERGDKHIEVVPTDKSLAKLVGAILHKSNSGSERLGDAHVVAVCAGTDTASVLTSDSGDILELASAIPATRILVRDPAKL